MGELGRTPPLSQGSVWRRWDPHVHLPGTLLNDQFGQLTVAEALNALDACQPQIQAVGVTDYFTTATYRAAMEAWQGGAGAGIKFLFPNVELRLAVPTAAGSGVNVHLICAPEHVGWLEQFVASLEFTWSDRPFRADRYGLISLGRAFRNDDALPEGEAIQEGARQFKVDFTQLRERYLRDVSAPERCLVAFAGGTSDGTSGVRGGDGGFAALRQQLERFAHIIFSGSAQQREFWLGRQPSDPPERLRQIYGGPKPCLQGSDAHRADKLGRPDLHRYTWLKGDPSFETLRLACLAPETRATIGPGNPAAGEEQGRVTEVAVEVGGWFSPGSIPLTLAWSRSSAAAGQVRPPSPT